MLHSYGCASQLMLLQEEASCLIILIALALNPGLPASDLHLKEKRKKDSKQ